MRIALTVGLAFAVVSLRAAPARAQEDFDFPTPDEAAEEVFARLRPLAHCDGPDAHPMPCLVFAGWAKGTAAPLPVGKALPGLTFVVIDGTSGDDPMDANHMMMSILAVRSVPSLHDPIQRIDITRATVDSGDGVRDQRVIPAMLAAIAGAGKRRAPTAAAAIAHLRWDLRAERELASQDFRLEDNSWTWRPCEHHTVVELRKVGAVWVSIESAPGWHAISVFPPR